MVPRKPLLLRVFTKATFLIFTLRKLINLLNVNKVPSNKIGNQSFKVVRKSVYFSKQFSPVLFSKLASKLGRTKSVVS